MSSKILNNNNKHNELKNTEQQAQSLIVLNNKHNELKNNKKKLNNELKNTEQQAQWA